MDYSPTGSSVHGILQARILERVAMPFSRSSWPRNRACVSYVSCTGRRVLFFPNYFNWRIITLQYCDGFCHTSTWISYRCTYVPLSWTPHPPPSPPHPSGLSQSTSFECPASCTEFALVIYFTYGNIHVSMLFSQIIPPSLSHTWSKSLYFISVSLLLPCIQDCLYHLSKFHIYVLIYCTGISLPGLLHSVQ